MKRVLSLLVCFLLLFSCACKKEEAPAPSEPDASPNPTENEKEFLPEISADSFYTYDGDLHNIYVNIALTTKELTAPVTTLSFELKNETDYYLDFPAELVHGHTWEKWENGKWSAFTKYNGAEKGTSEVSMKIIPKPHSTYTRTEEFAVPLNAGVYRLRMEYRLTNEKEEPFIIEGVPGIQCVAETYFTILPAPEA